MSEQPHGSVGDEAAKLAEAVQDWLGEWRGVVRLRRPRPPGGGAARRLGPRSTAALATTAPSAGSCPICQGLRLLRGVRPEVFEHLSDAATSLAAALRALAADAGGAGAARPERPVGRRATSTVG